MELGKASASANSACQEGLAFRSALAPPDESLALDILARLGEAFQYSTVEAEMKRLGDLDVPVATPRMLYRMKRDTVRLKDRADAELLKQLYHLEDEAGWCGSSGPSKR